MSCQHLTLPDSEAISAFLIETTGMIPGYTQYSAGMADLVYEIVDLGEVTLLWARSSAHCRWQDQMSDDGRVHFGFALDAARGITSLGHDLGPDDAMLFLPGQDMDYVFLGSVVTLEIAVSQRLVDHLGWRFSGTPLAKCPPHVLQNLATACNAAAQVALLPGIAPARLREEQSRVLTHLEAALSPWLADPTTSDAFRLVGSPSYQVMRQFDQLLADPDTVHANIAALSQQMGVSRRTLFYAVRKTIGLTPHKYHEILRLQQLRSQLKETSTDQTTVTQIATDLGFGDLGRMAGKYRKQFGENPLQTLQR